jgi:DNA mismatch repair protein MutS2
METPKIDVHGLTADEAASVVRANLYAFYDRGYHEVFIVHGKGQGILRQKVRSMLKSAYFVKKIRAGRPEEGGDGVTVAIF